jgi:hypothetical protein
MLNKIQKIIIGVVGLAIVFSALQFFTTTEEIKLGAPSYRIERTIFPETDSTYDLGTTTKRWRTGYFDTIDATNYVGITATTTWGTIAGTTLARIGSGLTTGQRLVLAESKVSIGAQCYHMASGTETLRFRLRALASGTIWATKEVAVSATGIVSIDWDTEYEIPDNTPFTVSVYNVTNAVYTNFSASPMFNGSAPSFSTFNLGAGITRLFGVNGVGDVAPTTTASNTYPVDLRIKA